MSSISATGGVQGLSQFLQSLSVNSAAPAAGTAPAADPTAAATDPTTAPPATQGARHHHGHHGGGNFQKVEAAVTSALQAAQSSGSTSDPNQVIKDAIAKVFQSSGTAAPTGASAPGGAPSPAATTNNGADASQQAFFQTLQSAGVDPKQFRADFLAAIQQAQGGQIDPSTAFQSVPPGTVLNTVG